MIPLNIFPLTLGKDIIKIDDDERNKLINEIKLMKNTKSNSNKTSYAWTGDTKGYEFLFSNKLFENLKIKISQCIITHSQSNISFAYYLLKPENSGGIIFRSNDLQNEIAKNIFTNSKIDKSLINKPNAYNSDRSVFDLEQDSIIIFPSKTAHATAPNKSGSPRISISGDVTVMLKNSDGFEHLMPNYKNWTEL